MAARKSAPDDAAATAGGMTVDDVLSQAVADPRSYYHGALLRNLLAYQPGAGVAQLQNAAAFLAKLTELEALSHAKTDG